MSGLKIIILGGGIAGLTCALALTKFSPKDAIPDITIYEIRPEPATIGGAVNLTPNAIRLLDYLGAFSIMKERQYGQTINAVEFFDFYSGKLAETSFRGENNEGLGTPPYKALRITRGDSLKAVLAAIEKHPNIHLHCGFRTTKILETPDSVTLSFSDGTTDSADLLMGCDGIHSVTRLTHVEPLRIATYSGVANAFGFAPRPKSIEPHFDSTAVHFARRGMLLTSFFEPSRSTIYVGGLMEVEDVKSRDGWKAKGADAEKLRTDMLERFKNSALPLIEPVIRSAENLFLWPVYTLSKGGKWATDRVMLLGDAAHAMPPQGESTGIVFEDAVLFSRCLCRWQDLQKQGNTTMTMKAAFNAYETLRRSRIDAAWEESKSVVGVVKDVGWVGHTIKRFLVPWVLWWGRGTREGHFIEDVTVSELGF